MVHVNKSCIYLHNMQFEVILKKYIFYIIQSQSSVRALRYAVLSHLIGKPLQQCHFPPFYLILIFVYVFDLGVVYRQIPAVGSIPHAVAAGAQQSCLLQWGHGL